MNVKNVFGDYNGSVTEEVLEKIRSIESLNVKVNIKLIKKYKIKLIKKFNVVFPENVTV